MRKDGTETQHTKKAQEKPSRNSKLEMETFVLIFVFAYVGFPMLQLSSLPLAFYYFQVDSIKIHFCQFFVTFFFLFRSFSPSGKAIVTSKLSPTIRLFCKTFFWGLQNVINSQKLDCQTFDGGSLGCIFERTMYFAFNQIFGSEKQMLG